MTCLVIAAAAVVLGLMLEGAMEVATDGLVVRFPRVDFGVSR